MPASLPDPSESTLEIRARARLGSTLNGKYRLERLLGVGGMASVYAATHRNTKRFAVKVFHPELSFNEDLRLRFVREGFLANSVGHPGAVAVLDEDTSDGETFLVMELLDGEAIDELCHRLGGRLSPRVALAVADALLDVLASAHARSIVHRDIKPANVFLTSDGELKVLDFGVARIRDASGNGATQSGLTMGTPAFMAPEQALARPAEIDGRTDIWSVGATLFSLLSGQQVHQASSGQEAMIWTATRQAPSLASVAPALPGALVRVIDRALAFARDDRWESAATMREAVRAAFLEIEGEPMSSAVLVAVAPPPHLQLMSRPPGGVSADPMGPTALGPGVNHAGVQGDGAGGGPERATSSSPQARSVVVTSNGTHAGRRAGLAVVALCLVALGATAGMIGSRGRSGGDAGLPSPTANGHSPAAAEPPSASPTSATPAAPAPSLPSPSTPVGTPGPQPSSWSRGSDGRATRGGHQTARPPPSSSASAAPAPTARDEFDHQ
jgi:serine/threonine protein kinase